MNRIPGGVNKPRGCETPPAKPQYARRVAIRERLTFWRQFRAEFATTGAIQPSSRFLARAMTRPLRTERRSGAVRIVEMGPGTGAVTEGIAAAMTASDELDCFEINPRFAAHLTDRIATRECFAAHRERIRVHTADARNARLDAPVDFVVCSVPLNNLPHDVVSAIFETGRSLLTGGGYFTYFEYLGLPRLRALLASREEAARIRQVRAAKTKFRGPAAETDIVLRNLPPARAVHVAIEAG
jgi:phospholipid N-methyltransferase